MRCLAGGENLRSAQMGLYLHIHTLSLPTLRTLSVPSQKSILTATKSLKHQPTPPEILSLRRLYLGIILRGALAWSPITSPATTYTHSRPFAPRSSVGGDKLQNRCLGLPSRPAQAPPPPRSGPAPTAPRAGGSPVRLPPACSDPKERAV